MEKDRTEIIDLTEAVEKEAPHIHRDIVAIAIDVLRKLEPLLPKERTASIRENNTLVLNNETGASLQNPYLLREYSDHIRKFIEEGKVKNNQASQKVLEYIELTFRHLIKLEEDIINAIFLKADKPSKAGIVTKLKNQVELITQRFDLSFSSEEKQVRADLNKKELLKSLPISVLAQIKMLSQEKNKAIFLLTFFSEIGLWEQDMNKYEKNTVKLLDYLFHDYSPKFLESNPKQEISESDATQMKEDVITFIKSNSEMQEFAQALNL